MIELGLLPGTAGPNRFGPPPGEDAATLHKRFEAEELIADEGGSHFDIERVDKAIAELVARRTEDMFHLEPEGYTIRLRSAHFGQAALFGNGRPTFGKRV